MAALRGSQHHRSVYTASPHRLQWLGRAVGRTPRLAESARPVIRYLGCIRWYRRLVAKQYDGSKTRRPGRPSTHVSHTLRFDT